MSDVAEIAGRLFATAPATLFTVFGGALLLCAIGLAFRAIRLLAGTRTGGTIIAWHERTTDGDTSYAPVFRFRAAMDGEFEVQSSTIWQDQPGDIHMPVSVLYDPKDPMRADIEGEHHPWRPVFAFLALAAAVFAVAWKAGA